MALGGYNAQKFPLTYELAQGSPGASAIYLFGRNPDVDTGSPEMLQDFAEGGPYPLLTTAEELFVSSDDAGDVGQVIFLRCLDENWITKDLVVSLNGQTSVQVPGGPYLRCLIAFNAGPVEHAGNVHIYRSSTVTGGAPLNSDELMRISASKQQSSSAMYTVPAGFTGYIDSIVLTVNRTSADSSADVALVTKAYNGVKRIRGELGLQSDGSSNFDYNFPVPLRVGEKTDVWLEAVSSSNNSDLAAGFQIVLIRN